MIKVNDLVRLRKEKNLTQEQLAQLVGVTRNYICMIEGGHKNGSLQVVSQIAKHLGVKIDDIFLG